MPKLLSRTAVVIAVLALSSPALAEGPTAEELKNRGNQAMMELNYTEALASYRAALEQNPNDFALHYNIGRAHQAKGDYPAALDALEEFDQKAPKETKAKVPSLAQLIADVRARVGVLDVYCSADVKGTVVVTASGADLARVEGCTATRRTVRVSLPSKEATGVEARLESEAFQASPVRVTVEGGGSPADVAFAVAPKTKTGVLRVKASPPNAVISVDGVPKGNPPVEIVVPAGSHVVDVRADSYEGAHVPFVMEAAGTKELQLALQKTPPLTKRWWFWAGAGAALAGLVTASVILIVQPERESSAGSIDPGVVRAPLATF